MEATAIHRYARVAPRKVRLVADLVRGMPVSRALEVLKFTRKSAALLLKKVVDSALANAVEHSKNEKLEKSNIDNLIISRVFVDEGPMFKRFMPRAQGRATKIQKKTSHITVVLSES